MRFIQYLNEVYIDRFESPVTHKSYEIFKNPSTKEIRQLYTSYKDEHSGLRFFIDLKKKDVYVFYGDMMHHMVREKLNLNTGEWMKTGPRWLWGEGEYVNNKIEIVGISDDIPPDTDWLYKYFIKE